MVVAKLTYASSSWWGFTTASDRQRLEGFLRRGCRQNLYSTDKPSIAQIVEEADENLFNSIRYNPSHLLHQLLPRRTESIQLQLVIQTPQLLTLPYPRWQKFYWPHVFLSIPQRVTSYPSYPGYTDIILTLVCILSSTWCVLSSF